MKIGGLEKFSLIDYPDHLSVVVFTVGCTFRCPFCYNPMLVPTSLNIASSKDEADKSRNFFSEDGFFQFLESRKGKLDGVVITGGEPTMQPDLLAFLKKIKALGFDVKVDTNGTNPEMLKKIIKGKVVDYLAMDLKCDKAGYKKACGVEVDFGKIEESVKIIKESLPAGRQAAVPYEFRTTCVPGFIDKEAIENMGKIIKGADKWYLQNFKSDAEMIDMFLINRPGFSEQQMKEFVEIGRKYVKLCEVRG